MSRRAGSPSAAAVNGKYVSSFHESLRHDLELHRRSGKSELESAITRMVVDERRLDQDAFLRERTGNRFDGSTGLRAYGDVHDALDSLQLVLDTTQPGENDGDERARAGGGDVVPGADRDSDGGDHPDRRRRCQPRNHAAALHD